MKITSEEDGGDDRIPAQEIPDDEDNPSREPEGVKRIPPQNQASYSQVCMLRRPVTSLYSTRGIIERQFP